MVHAVPGEQPEAGGVGGHDHHLGPPDEGVHHESLGLARIGGQVGQHRHERPPATSDEPVQCLSACAVVAVVDGDDDLGSRARGGLDPVTDGEGTAQLRRE
jgi:hypothetical protein